MKLSIITAWCAVILSLICAAKIFIRVMAQKGGTKAKAFNKSARKSHIYIGILAVVFALIHSVLAGNPAWATPLDFEFAPLLFNLNTGTFSLILLLLLLISWIFRKALKRSFFPIHRFLTAALISALICHLIVQGITIFNVLLKDNDNITSSMYSDSADESSKSNDSSSESKTDIIVSQSETQSIVQNTQFAGATLKDGTYEGSGTGYRGTVTVSVIVKDGAVTKITALSYRDDSQYFSRALSGITGQIIKDQDLSADAVTGATYSSNGIISAVENALKNAVISGTLEEPSLKTPTQKSH